MLFKDIGKLGLVFSFFAAVAYEITGAISFKAVSIIIGALSLVILSSYLAQTQLHKAKDILMYLRLLK
jgi:hypothetical protein